MFHDDDYSYRRRNLESPAEVYTSFLRRLNIHGRISRQYFWLAHLALAFLLIGVWVLYQFLLADYVRRNNLEILVFFFLLIAIPVGSFFGATNIIALQIRRWHDFDRTGWWVLSYILPCIGLVIGLFAHQRGAVWWNPACYFILGIFILFLGISGFIPGTQGPNRFGDPGSGTLGTDTHDYDSIRDAVRTTKPQADKKSATARDGITPDKNYTIDESDWEDW